MHGHYTSPPPPSARSHRRPTGMRVSIGMRDVRSVYLGGNINRNDWRRSLVAGLGAVGVAPAYPVPANSLWPVLPGAVVGRFDYVGPYSISGDPTDDAEWNNENADEGSEWVVSGPLYAPQRGPRVSSDPAAPYKQGGQTQPSLGQTTSSQEVWWPLVRAARQVKRLVLEALHQTDLYFAWLDTPMCASTLTEVGWAQSNGKILWLAGPQAFDELWLAYTMADQYSFRYRSPADAFQNMLQLAVSSGF
ncbi:MAG: hypothetical protein ACLQUY_25370 [Ktedonobacterales bacterium]